MENVCEYCLKDFSRKTNLLRHLRTVHSDVHTDLGSSWKTKRRKVCCLCEFEGIKEDVLEHFESQHGISVGRTSLQFSSVPLFEKWKSEIEKETLSHFIKARENYTCKDGSIKIQYYCHRNGYYIKKGLNIRNIKRQKSNKINGFCPAEIIVIKKSNEILVKFTDTHIGHSMDLEHLTLNAQERKEIASKIQQNIPFDTILDEIRDSMTGDNCKRIHLITKQDLYNIENTLKPKMISNNNMNSVQNLHSWILQLKSNMPFVRYYKSQGSICETYSSLRYDDFVLIFLNNVQLDRLRKFGSNCLCIDRSHAVDSSNFELITCLILDSKCKCVPCAFMISNRIEVETIKIFFETLKCIVGTQLKPKMFMSDVSDSFYIAWQQVMQEPQIRLFCSWHVDKDWRLNLSKVNSQEKQISIYKKVRTLLEETDDKAFEVMLFQMCEDLNSDEQTKLFGEYFRKYQQNPSVWAYSFTNHTGTNTNEYLERMHKTLTHIFIKNIKHLDKALLSIMIFARDELFDQFVTINEGDDIKEKLVAKKYHDSALETNSVPIFVKDTCWEVSSPENGSNTIIKGDIECKCQLRCDLCSCCIHNYVCSCCDSFLLWAMCEHIHYLSSTLNNPNALIANTNENMVVFSADGKMLLISDENNPSTNEAFTIVDIPSNRRLLEELNNFEENDKLPNSSSENEITPMEDDSSQDVLSSDDVDSYQDGSSSSSDNSNNGTDDSSLGNINACPIGGESLFPHVNTFQGLNKSCLGDAYDYLEDGVLLEDTNNEHEEGVEVVGSYEGEKLKDPNSFQLKKSIKFQEACKISLNSNNQELDKVTLEKKAYRQVDKFSMNDVVSNCFEGNKGNASDRNKSLEDSNILWEVTNNCQDDNKSLIESIINKDIKKDGILTMLKNDIKELLFVIENLVEQSTNMSELQSISDFLKPVEPILKTFKLKRLQDVPRELLSLTSRFLPSISLLDEKLAEMLQPNTAENINENNSNEANVTVSTFDNISFDELIN